MPIQRPLLLATAFVLNCGFIVNAQAASPATCYSVTHVRMDDVLNLRAAPSADSAIVARMPPSGHGPIRKMDGCTPANVKWSRRWCRVSYTEGNRIRIGWVKRYFVRTAACPGLPS